LQTVAVVAVAAMAWRTAALVTLPPVALVGEGATTEHAAIADRRRPGIDRMSGLCAPWYFRLRVEEEIARCERYGGALTVVRVTGETQQLNVARKALADRLRRVDVPGDFGDMVAVMLPATDRAGAEVLVGRLREATPGVEFAVTEHPADGTTVEALLGQHAWSTDDLPGFSAAA
jgi:hypothetical protein